ncbi:MAG: hypothetical protein V3V96_15595 [Acidiferrobacterales bacterium]
MNITITANTGSHRGDETVMFQSTYDVPANETHTLTIPLPVGNYTSVSITAAPPYEMPHWVKSSQTWPIMKNVMDELERATKLHGPMRSPHEGYAVLKEEVDELWNEVKTDSDPKHMRLEAIQIAAMAMRFVLDITDEEDGTNQEG